MLALINIVYRKCKNLLVKAYTQTKTVATHLYKKVTISKKLMQKFSIFECKEAKSRNPHMRPEAGDSTPKSPAFFGPWSLSRITKIFFYS